MNRSYAIAATAILASGAAGCAASTQAPAARASPPEDLTLRAYSMPGGQAPRMRPVLGNLLMRGKEPLGRVGLAPDGRLLVFAPARVQQDVQALLADTKSVDATPSTPPTLAFTHWLVLAEPGPSPDAERCGSNGLACLRGGPEVAKAVEALDRSQPAASGGFHYTLVEQLGIRSLDSEHAEVHGATAHVKQRASMVDHKIVADVDVRVLDGSAPALETRLDLIPGRSAVVAQVAYHRSRAHGDREPDGTLLFLTRASVEE